MACNLSQYCAGNIAKAKKFTGTFAAAIFLLGQLPRQNC